MNWKATIIAVLTALAQSIVLVHTQTPITSWADFTKVSFWMALLVMMVGNGYFAHANFRSRDSRTRAEDSQPLKLDLFDKNGGNK
jgi:hypothetical protein